jgi:uncharacterized protein YciI
MHYLMIYDLSPDYLERRQQFRAEHLKLAWEFVDRGEMILGGALGDPIDSAAILFESDSQAVAERFVAADPYVKNGLVTGWRVRPWITVAGKGSTTPIRSE